jgi:hypothetical protein
MAQRRASKDPLTLPVGHPICDVRLSAVNHLGQQWASGEPWAFEGEEPGESIEVESGR